ATKYISGCNYLTIGMVVSIYSHLLDTLEKFIKQSSIITIKNVAKAAKNKLKKYYPTTDGLVYIIGTILNPRHKLTYYKEHEFDDYIKLYNNQIKNLWKSKYQPYQNNQNDNQDDNNQDIDQDTDQDNDQNSDQDDIKKVNIDELDIYLRDPAIDPYKILDILNW
ncbi:19085_t:CDS:2, partial [Racocetra fulgida]